MYCTKCGKSIAKDQKYCGFCGITIQTQNRRDSFLSKRRLVNLLFVGRMKRLPYLKWNLIIAVIIGTPYYILMTNNGYSDYNFGLLGTSTTLMMVIATTPITVKRLHDLNLPGWLALIVGLINISVVIIGVILNIMLLLIPGSKENNNYGSGLIDSEDKKKSETSMSKSIVTNNKLPKSEAHKTKKISRVWANILMGISFICLPFLVIIPFTKAKNAKIGLIYFFLSFIFILIYKPTIAPYTDNIAYEMGSLMAFGLHGSGSGILQALNYLGINFHIGFGMPLSVIIHVTLWIKLNEWIKQINKAAPGGNQIIRKEEQAF